MGTIYRRGNNYWLKYYRAGKAYYESSGSGKIEVAKRLLKLREGEISQGKLPGICFDRVLFDELAEDYLRDYRVNNKKTYVKAEQCVSNLLQDFSGVTASNITTSGINKYVEKRMNEGVANATINRELSAMKRMFNIAARSTPPKVAHVPFIQMLSEDNVRKGFFEYEDYQELTQHLPDYLKHILTFAYFTGCRRGEILNLRWDQVNLHEGSISLSPGETKNKQGRTIYMEPELLSMMKDLQLKRIFRCPYVFHHDGKQIKHFRKAWITACRRAGLPGMIFHDLRRSAVRDMIRAGIPERIAMSISGHKTRSVFDRYNIVSADDLKEAARKNQVYREEQLSRLQFGYNGENKRSNLFQLIA